MAKQKQKVDPSLKVGDEPNKPQRTPDELRKALEQCEINRRKVKKTKKSVTSAYNEQLADLDDEITGTLDQLKNLAAPKA